MSQDGQSVVVVALTNDREERDLVTDGAVDSPFQVVEVAPLGQADSQRPLTQANCHVYHERPLVDTDAVVEPDRMEMEYQGLLLCRGAQRRSEEASHG